MTDAHDTDVTGIWARSTAPQSGYSMREVIIGLVVLAVGLVVTFGLAIAVV